MPDVMSGNPEDRAVRLKRILAAHELAGGSGPEAVMVESALPDDVALPKDHEVLGRTEAGLASRQCGHDEAEKFGTARDLLLTHADAALEKLTAGKTDLSPDQFGALEAIIIADGSRPSFLLQDGKPDLHDPTMGGWGDTVSTTYPATQAIARAVGRIQPGNGHASRYIGTGSLIDAAALLVLTNYHVIDDAEKRFGVAMERNGQSIKVTGTLEIDFDGEADSLGSNRFRIVSVDLPVGFGRGFGAIDAAVARIEAIPGATLPASVPVLSRDAAYANGGMVSLATIGFPGPPPATSGQSGEVDWSFVTKTLFRNKFGFKRLAPGRFTSARGSDPTDLNRTAFGHDATSFGGASGSLIIAWLDENAPSFGLHFVGQTGVENHALALAAAAAALADIGVRFA